MTRSELAAELGALISGSVLAHEPLARHTTLRLGGPADLLALPRDSGEVIACLDFARRKGLPVRILGNGSNVLVADAGVRGLVVKMARLQGLAIEGDLARAGAGLALPKLVRATASRSLAGLEHLAGIPGSVGGAAVMNAGTPEGALGDCVQAVSVLRGREIINLPRRDLGYAYRSSRLKRSGEIVLAVTLRLAPGERGALEAAIREKLSRRRQTQPLAYPNAGSVFKNPPGDAAGRLIELIGAKGWQSGGAQVSKKHANFIVNRGGATSGDVLDLIGRIRAAVQRECGVTLELEVEVWGEGP